MRQLARRIKIAKYKYDRARKAKNEQRAQYARFLRSAELMACEYPKGTSPHFIAYKLLRSKEQLDNRKYL
jgi:hypothetical protein